MNWVDTHCHLQLDERDPDELLKRAPTVDWLVVPGIDASSSRAALELAALHPGRLFASAGLHPHEASAWPSQADDIAALARSGVAVGETGLDFYRDLSPRPDQRRAFLEQIDLADELDKPIIVHCRDAFSDVFEILSESGAGPRAVLHSWTGGTRWTKRFLELGVSFSFSGTLAFETADTIRRAAAIVPPERALVETDTPYLAPPPHRGEMNEPAWVAYVGEALSAVWGMAPEDVSAMTSRNAARVFR